ncbi:MAG TPA: hypothetical protein VF331_01495 [Polyangiales bacterium]
MRRHLQWLVIALALSVPAVAHARREVTFSYPFSRVWPSVVRLMRVDFECQITEKDKEDGYFFFDYPDHGKTFPGSVELVTSKSDGVETVRVVIQVPAMPSYVEALMLDKLGRKLLEEFGPPKGATPPSTDAPKPEEPQQPSGEPPAKPAAPAQNKPNENRPSEGQRN